MQNLSKILTLSMLARDFRTVLKSDFGQQKMIYLDTLGSVGLEAKS
ncbi:MULTISPECIES: hypothetical protein [Spirulina sp. CCY15215]|nr:hypothetical protein [Spirulina major]